MKKLLTFLMLIVTALTFISLGNKTVDANTNVQLYCLISTEKLAGRTLKANVCQSKHDNKWDNAVMQDTGKTFGGKKIFMASLMELHGGFDVIQFQIYEGSTWKEQEEIKSWITVSDIEGNMYDYEERAWVTYAYDILPELSAAISFEYSYENSNSGKIYFTNPGWSEVYCYMWVDGEVNNGWPGTMCTVVLEDDGYGHKVYSCDIFEGAKFAIFNNGNNGGSQTGNIPLSDISSQYYIDGGLKQCVYDASVNVVLEKVELMFALKDVDKLTGYEKYKIEVKCGVNTQTSEEFAATEALKNLVVKVNVTGHETEEITAVLYGVNGSAATKLNEVVYSAKTVAQTYFDSYATNDAVMKHWNAIAAITALPSAE